MARLEQEGDPLLLGRDRVILRVLQDLEPLRLELAAPFGARIAGDLAVDLERRLLAARAGSLEELFADVGLRDNALDQTGSVAHLEEVQLLAGAAVVEPTLDPNALAHVRAERIYGHGGSLVLAGHPFPSRSDAVEYP